MPQLAVETFFTQYFWLVVILFSFYYYLMTYFIPYVSYTLKTRAKLSERPTLQNFIDENTDSLDLVKFKFNVVEPKPFKGQIKAYTNTKINSLKSPKADLIKKVKVIKNKTVVNPTITKTPKTESKKGKSSKK